MTRNISTFIIWIFIFIFSISCNHSYNPVSDFQYRVISDTLHIQTDTDFFKLCSFSDTALLIIKKSTIDSLDFYMYSTEGFKKLKSTYVKDQSLFAPSAEFGGINKIQCINTDSLIFFKTYDVWQNYRFFLYSAKMDSILYDSYFFPEKMYTGDTVVKYCMSDQFLWNPKTRRIGFYFYRGNDTSVSDKHFFAEIDPDNNEVIIHDIPLPSVYNTKPNEVFPWRDRIFVTLNKNNNYVFCFGITNEIIEYDPASQTTEIHRVEHKNYSKPISYVFEEKVNGDDFVSIGEQTFAYLNLLFNTVSEEYVRVYYMELPEKDEDRYINDVSEKQMGFSIIDKSFNTIGEVLLSENEKKFYSYFTATPMGPAWVKQLDKRIIAYRIEVIRK
jgi:hypothetical protein